MCQIAELEKLSDRIHNQIDLAETLIRESRKKLKVIHDRINELQNQRPKNRKRHPAR
jgi:hypothetical protein